MFVISLCITILSHFQGDIRLRDISVIITIFSIITAAFYVDRRENHIQDQKTSESEGKDVHLV